MRFQVLVDAMVADPALRQAIAVLLAMKRVAMEAEYGRPLPIINAFIDAELARLESALPPERGEMDFSMLDRLLLETVLRFDCSGEGVASSAARL